jgi:hypothetical protein
VYKARSVGFLRSLSRDPKNAAAGGDFKLEKSEMEGNDG